MTLLRALSFIACILALSFGTGLEPAHAQGTESKARALYTSGIQAFKAGEFDKAGVAFMEAHSLDPSASLLWNAARSFDKSGAVKDAHKAYSGYVKHPEAKADKRSKAEAWLREHPLAPESAPRPAEESEGLKRLEEHSPLVSQQSRPQSGHATWAGWTLVSLASVGFVGASVAMILAQSSRDESAALVWDEGYLESLEKHQRIAATTETRELAAWTTYGAAIGLMSAGLVLLLSRPEAESSMRKMPSAFGLRPEKHGLSAHAAWRF